MQVGFGNVESDALFLIIPKVFQIHSKYYQGLLAVDWGFPSTL